MAGRARREWGSGSCYQTAKGYWRVSVPIAAAGPGRRRQEWQYRTEAAARRQLEAVQRRLARGLPAEEGRVTVAEYAQDWLGQLQRSVEFMSSAVGLPLKRILTWHRRAALAVVA